MVEGGSKIGFDELFNRFGEADSKEIFCSLGGLSRKALSRLGIGACDDAMGIASREGLVFRAKLELRTAFGYYLARNVPDTALENTPAGHIFAARAILVNDVAGFAELAAIERRPWELERRWQELVRDEVVFLEAAKE